VKLSALLLLPAPNILLTSVTVCCKSILNIKYNLAAVSPVPPPAAPQESSHAAAAAASTHLCYNVISASITSGIIEELSHLCLQQLLLSEALHAAAVIINAATSLCFPTKTATLAFEGQLCWCYYEGNAPELLMFGIHYL
jgi:hypothetical protein